MMTNPERDADFESADIEASGVLARTMPAPPMEEHARIEYHNRKRFMLQCVTVLVIGGALYWCFGTASSRLVAKLFGLRRTSWLPESLTCGILIFLPLVPIVWRHVRRTTQTPRS